MVVSTSSKPGSSSHFRAQKLPVDASELALGPDPCHCVADAELDNRYNVLRAEEHARKEGKCGPDWSTTVSQYPENESRNRYASVVPWDHSRVLLPVEPGANDYINASWVELGSRTYIATQGPLSTTAHDFWQMVYAYGGDPAMIVMLTPLYEHSVQKSIKYWPDPKSEPISHPKERGFRFGLTVSLQSHHAHEHYEYSSLLLTPTDSSMAPRHVHHVYYHSWLDYSKPNADQDLRQLIHLVNNRLRNPSSPPIVHCSAGIGRTGTFIAIDALMSQVDTDMIPAVTPRVVPIWLADQHAIQFRTHIFTGAKGIHDESSPQRPMLSNYDMSSVNETDKDTLSTTKGEVPVSLRTHSILTSALDEQRRKGASSPPSVIERGPHDMNGNHPATIPEEGDGVAPNEGADGKQTSNGAVANGYASSGGKTFVDSEEHPVPPEEANAKSSALSGPVIKKVHANITYVSQEVFSETPVKVNVMKWFDVNDPVMSTIRCMRKQRPKMVQGKQQLGYIYDQFEVAQQLAKATSQHNTIVRRHSTVSSISSSLESDHSPSHKGKSHKFFHAFGLRRSSSTLSTSMSDHEGHSIPRKHSIFHGSRLR